MNPTLADLENQIGQLPPEDQRLLFERLSHRLRQESDRKQFVDDLEKMARDPEIRAELRRIEEEFRETELDGLEKAG